MTVQGLENAKISSTTVHLLGYTVHNRVIVDKKYFPPLTAVTPISPATGEFTIVAVDYPDATKVRSTLKYLILTNLIFCLRLILLDSSRINHQVLVHLEVTDFS